MQNLKCTSSMLIHCVSWSRRGMLSFILEKVEDVWEHSSVSIILLLLAMMLTDLLADIFNNGNHSVFLWPICGSNYSRKKHEIFWFANLAPFIPVVLMSIFSIFSWLSI